MALVTGTGAGGSKAPKRKTPKLTGLKRSGLTTPIKIGRQQESIRRSSGSKNVIRTSPKGVATAGISSKAASAAADRVAHTVHSIMLAFKADPKKKVSYEEVFNTLTRHEDPELVRTKLNSYMKRHPGIMIDNSDAFDTGA